MKNKSGKIITRFAPSPTGKFHVGGIRSALYNFLYAKKYGGKFILRCEDTDPARSKKEFENYFLEVFEWLSLKYDEYYRQSERMDIYKTYLKKLVEEDRAYVSKEKSEEDGAENEVIRFRNPGSIVNFNDLVLGPISFNTEDLKDFIIARNFDSPLYHFTVVVDDFEMAITHVIRGQEHVSNTARQILVQKAIGAPTPFYAHASIILNEKREKLSKRDPLVRPTLEYRDDGYLPEAMLNFMAFLGWNPGGTKEIYTMEEMINDFSIEKMQKAPAIFNPQKLLWTNKEHLKNISDEKFLEYIDPAIENLKKLPQWDKERLEKMLPELRERVEVRSLLLEEIEKKEYFYIFKEPVLDIEKIIPPKESVSKGDVARHLENVLKLLEDLSIFKKEEIKNAIFPYATKEGRGVVLWPMRYALSGQERSIDPFTLAYILGKEEAVARIKKSLEMLK